MKRPLTIIFAIAMVIFGLATWHSRVRAKAEAELWAEATDEI